MWHNDTTKYDALVHTGIMSTSHSDLNHVDDVKACSRLVVEGKGSWQNALSADMHLAES